MGKRAETRVFIALPVRVYGLDQVGQPFSQTALTLDISATGARIEGIRCLRSAGEMVTVEYAGRSAQFRVVWIGHPGSGEDGHIGLKCLQRDKHVWQRHFETSGVDPFIPPPDLEENVSPFAPLIVPSDHDWDGNERRAAVRLRCTGTARISQKSTSFPTFAKVVDISYGGCYVELIFTISRESKIEIELRIKDRVFTATGVVMTCHPGVGVGIKFTDISSQNQSILADIIREVSSSLARPNHSTDSANPSEL